MNDHQSSFLAVSVVMLILTMTIVPLRCYSRLLVISRLAIEDYVMIATQILFFILLCINFANLAAGFGQHDYQFRNIPAYQAPMKGLFFNQIFYALALTCARVSIGMLFLRLISGRFQRMTIYALLALNVVTGLMFAIWVITQCHPVNAFWNLGLRAQRGNFCRTVSHYLVGCYLHAAASIFIDWILASMPIYVLVKSKLDPQTRYTTALVCLVGVLASIMTVVRLWRVRVDQRLGLTDFSYKFTVITTWSTAEVGLLIFAGCAATLLPLSTRTLKYIASASRVGQGNAASAPTDNDKNEPDTDAAEMRALMGQAQSEEKGPARGLSITVSGLGMMPKSPSLVDARDGTNGGEGRGVSAGDGGAGANVTEKAYC